MDKEQTPITFLHAETNGYVVADNPENGFAPENDTLYAGSGDSDTKHQVICSNSIEIFTLIGGFWGDLFLARRIEPRLQEMILKTVSTILGDLFESIAEFLF